MASRRVANPSPTGAANQIAKVPTRHVASILYGRFGMKVTNICKKKLTRSFHFSYFTSE